MNNFIEKATQKYSSLESFINSYLKGNDQTDDEPYPEWGNMLSTIVGVMRAGGLDSEDIINGLEEDLEVIDHFMESEETDKGD